MKTLQVAVIALFAILGLTAAAEATVDLWTPPLLVATGEEFICVVFNPTTRTVTVNIAISTAQRGVVVNSGPFSLLPKSFATIGSPPLGGGEQATCDFTVPSRTMVRATAQTSVTNIAVPAQ